MAFEPVDGTAKPAGPFAQTYFQRAFLALAVTIPFCLFLGARGFAPCIGVAGLVFLPFARPTRADWIGVGILTLLVTWAAVSVAWSPAPNLHMPHNIKELSRFTVLHLGLQLVLCAALVTAAARVDGRTAKRALTALAVALLVAQALLIEEGVSRAALYQAMMAATHNPTRPDLAIRALAQGGHVTAVLVWPLGIALARQGRVRAALAMAAFVPVSALLMRGFGPSAALAISLVVFVIVQKFGRPAILALLGLTVAYWFVEPFVLLLAEHYGILQVLQAHLPPSWADRIRIWNFVVDQFTLQPVRGAGLDASRTFPDIVPLHPHNGPLQLWYELGLPGAFLGTAFLGWLWWCIAQAARRDRQFAAVAAATVTVYLVMSVVDFGLWQEWWICLGALGMAACVAFGKMRAEPRADLGYGSAS